MQTRNRIMEDISQLMTNAMGVAQGAQSEEAETAMKSMIDRWLADRDFVTREEFEAVRAMAQKAREENEALKARLDALEAGGGTSQGRLTEPPIIVTEPHLTVLPQNCGQNDHLPVGRRNLANISLYS